MTELRFRASVDNDYSDLTARFDDHTTVGQLADELELRLDRRGDRPRTIQRKSRGGTYFARTALLSQVDVRNGDEICLALDTGLRAASGVHAAASLRVVSGPDTGRTYELRRGESTVGRSSKCDVTLNDEMASRRHATIRVSDTIEVADAGSTNGVEVNDSTIEGVSRLRPGDRLTIGDTTLIADLTGGSHEAVDVVDNLIEFNRPPRIEGLFKPVKIALPSPLEDPPKQRFPLIAALVPLFMGGVMFALTKSIYSGAFMALSPVMLLGNFIESRRSGKADYLDRKAEFEATMQDRISQLDETQAEEIRKRFRFAPDNSELLGCATDLTERLWEREPEHPDFLSLRLGVKEQNSAITVELGQGGKRDQRREQEAVAEKYRRLPPVPLVFDGRSQGPVGVAGRGSAAEGVARSLILQSATLHSPSELVIGAIVSAESAQTWDWLKWLPHRHSNSPLAADVCATGVDATITLLAALNELIAARQLSSKDTSDQVGVLLPHLLLLVDGSIAVERTRFKRLLEDGRTAGITVVWLADDIRRIPNACRSIIEIEPGGGTLTLSDSVQGTQSGGVPVEAIQRESAEVVARALSPIIDISADSGEASDLPRTVGLIDLLGGLEVIESPAPILDRWRQSAEAGALRAAVGQHEGGSLSIDLRVDGPHGLVGGTTGAGKSEFLQALIASLSANHGPDRITFLLVDYKGGSAFGELVDHFDDSGELEWKGLRHTVGMITDLTPTLVDRALTSLRAELHRREILIGKHRAKDLMEMERSSNPETPPSLLIVIDEFAALAKEVPAFVDGVVDIAQRGRSLGMHLLLATQKPGGVITPNIQANTNLRVALRMASEDESTDVVDSPIAGQIDRSTPGRGVMRRGPSDLVAFQSAYVGGTTTSEAQAGLELGELTLSGVHWFGTDEDKPSLSADNGESDLKRLVRSINLAADTAGHGTPRRPWIDPLPPVVSLIQLPRPQTDQRIPFGLADAPHDQTRTLAYFEPDAMGSMLLYGMGATGKTTALRAIAVSFGLVKAKTPVHVYALDFAGRSLQNLTPMPHVGDVIAGDDYERVTRLLKNLRTEISSRSERFAVARSSNLAEFRAAPGGDPETARIVVLVDGYDNFTASFESLDRGQWAELLPRLVADGRAVGVHFILSGTRRNSFPISLAAAVSARMVFRLASDDDYHSVNAEPSWFDLTTPSGRCRLGDKEIQVALIGDNPSTLIEAQAIQRLGSALAKRLPAAPEVRILPDEISTADLPKPVVGVPWLLTEDFEAAGPPLDQNLLIAGRPRSGKTTALHTMIKLLTETGHTPEVYSFDPSRAPFPSQDFHALNNRLAVNPNGVVFIDNAERLSGSPAEFAIQSAVQNATLTVVASADSSAARSFDATLKSIRARCDVLLLQPDADMDGDLVGQPLPRVARRFPPGRGYFRANNTMTVVQVAIAAQ